MPSTKEERHTAYLKWKEKNPDKVKANSDACCARRRQQTLDNREATIERRRLSALATLQKKVDSLQKIIALG